MASAAAISTLLRPPRVHPARVASASPLPMHALPFLPRRPGSLATVRAVQTQQGAAAARSSGATQRSWTSAPVAAVGAATEDESIFLVTVDLSGAPALVDAYTTPGQYLMARVPSQKLSPAYMCISSAPRSGLQFDLLVKPVPGTTSEQLCKLGVGDAVELGPVMGRGFAIQHINPPAAAETMFLFAVGMGISPIRALIEFGFAASERKDVRLYYAAKDLQSMPYQERFNNWEQTGVKVVQLTQQFQQSFLEQNLGEKTVNPLSTGAVIVAPSSSQEVITGVLLDFGVPHEKILTIEWSPEDPFASKV